jgi:hypothetical protein
MHDDARIQNHSTSFADLKNLIFMAICLPFRLHRYVKEIAAIKEVLW